MRTLFLLTSLTAVFGCPSDDSDTDATATDPTTTATDPTTTSPTTTSPTTTDPTGSESESSTASTTDPTGSESGSESGTESGSTDPDTGTGSSSESGGEAVCDLYCAAYLANCSEFGEQYDDEADCLATCAGFDPGTPGDMDGDSAECRLYHAGAAAAMPDVHCVHAQETPEGGCV